jgi:tetratricopeptide (TPR) repeat protein
MHIKEKVILANDLYKMGKLQQAGNICLDILKLQPNNIEALHCMGLICFDSEKYDFAENFFARIIELDPTNTNIRNCLKATLKEKRLLLRFISENVNIDDIKSVCLILGPYRNLTSLTAAVLFLHPSCQVLNHAAMRILHKNELNFFMNNYDIKKFNSFLKYAICISEGGKRGPFGGSITLEHSFDRDNIRRSYRNRYGDSLIKEEIRCFIWKESSKISNLMKQNNINLEEIFLNNNKLKFLMPIRNPLDCAESNMTTGHKIFISDLNQNSSFEEVLECIIKEFSWFINLQRKYPERFFHFFENSFTEKILLNLANFLNINQDGEWIKSALSNFQITKKYAHAQGRITFYKNLVNKYLKDCPEDLEKFLLFS